MKKNKVALCLSLLLLCSTANVFASRATSTVYPPGQGPGKGWRYLRNTMKYVGFPLTVIGGLTVGYQASANEYFPGSRIPGLDSLPAPLGYHPHSSSPSPSFINGTSLSASPFPSPSFNETVVNSTLSASPFPSPFANSTVFNETISAPPTPSLWNRTMSMIPSFSSTSSPTVTETPSQTPSSTFSSSETPSRSATHSSAGKKLSHVTDPHVQQLATKAKGHGLNPNSSLSDIKNFLRQKSVEELVKTASKNNGGINGLKTALAKALR